MEQLKGSKCREGGRGAPVSSPPPHVTLWPSLVALDQALANLKFHVAQEEA
jgi:hypothetical protein